MTATATYSDGSTAVVTTLASWTSGTEATATVGAATGLVTSVDPGTSVITATYQGKSGNTTATVTWSPVTNGAVVWLDIDSGITLNGSDASAWASRTGSNNATQATAINQPAYSATGGPNNGPYLDFDVDEHMLVAHSASYKTAQVTLAVVIKYDSAVAFQHAVNTSDAVNWGTGYGIGKINATGGNTDISAWTTGYNTNHSDMATLGTSNYHVVIMRWDGTNVRGQLDGVDATDDAFAGPITHGTGAMCIGGAISSAVGPTYAFSLNGRMTDVVVFPSSLSNTNTTNLYNYLADKRGL